MKSLKETKAQYNELNFVLQGFTTTKPYSNDT